MRISEAAAAREERLKAFWLPDNIETYHFVVKQFSSGVNCVIINIDKNKLKSIPHIIEYFKKSELNEFIKDITYNKPHMSYEQDYVMIDFKGESMESMFKYGDCYK